MHRREREHVSCAMQGDTNGRRAWVLGAVRKRFGNGKGSGFMQAGEETQKANADETGNHWETRDRLGVMDVVIVDKERRRGI